MIRSYEVALCLEKDRVGFNLYLFEDDDCIWEEYFTNKNNAEKRGEKYLDGKDVYTRAPI